MNIKAEERDSDDSILKKPVVEWSKTSKGGCCNEDSDNDDSDDELVYATGFPPPPPGKRLAPVGQEVDAEEVRDAGKEAPQVSRDMIGFDRPFILDSDGDGKAIRKFRKGLSLKLFRFAKLRPINF